MVGSEPGEDTDDCKFPSVRKTFWRSATWNATTAPPFSSNTLTLEGEESVGVAPEKAPLCTPRSQERSASFRTRVPLLPLQPLSIATRSFDDWPSAHLDDSPDLTSPITPGRRRVKAGLDIKLDLASVHRSIVEPTEIQLRRDKFALFDKQCSRVAKYHIYLGSDAVARDREVLRTNGITHVLNCVGFVCPEYFKGDLEYKTLWLQDSPCEDLMSLLYDVFDYFEEVREQGDRVFVHCCQGVSRSTSLVIAYVMWREHKSFEEAFQDVKAARGVANPNMGFACQLLQCQKRMHAAPVSPKSVLRMYRLAPHSPYDPLHLVLKACTNPGAGSLDSRGAFVIHVPCAIFIWIGQDCDPKMAHEAEEAVIQVIRYERADVPVKVFTEGNESLNFWNTFSDCPQLCSKEQVKESDCPPQKSVYKDEDQVKSSQIEVERVDVGSRKVLSNDTDYSLYHIARLGGVLPPVPFTNGGMEAISTRIPVHEDGWSSLRRKVWSREQACAHLTLSSEALNPSSLSPNISMGSSSPHFSSFSVTSVSSSTPTGSDTCFDSPLSSLCNLSPCTPELDPAASIRCSSPCITSLHCASLPPKTPAGSCGGKVPASSLAERRGGLPPSLLLPGLEDVPPPAPRGTSRKPRLPPLITVEDRKKESTEIKCKDKNLMLVQRQPLSLLAPFAETVSGEDLCTRSTTMIPEKGSSSLYLWPGLEIISMFDADDLDTKGVFLLVESRGHSTECNQRILVYVWVGQQLASNKEILGKDTTIGNEMAWHQVGQDFVGRMQLPTDTTINVVREGHEPEEFWEAFNGV